MRRAIGSGRLALIAITGSLFMTMLPGIASAQSSEGEPIVDLSGGEAVSLMVVVVLLVALVWMIPYLYDLRKAYGSYQVCLHDLLPQLTSKAAHGEGGLTEEELKALVGVMAQGPPGVKGLVRSLLALTTLSIVGVALIALFLSSAADAGDLRKTIITALLSVFATIVGFYFGSRASEVSTSPAEREVEGRPRLRGAPAHP